MHCDQGYFIALSSEDAFKNCSVPFKKFKRFKLQRLNSCSLITLVSIVSLVPEIGYTSENFKEDADKHSKQTSLLPAMRTSSDKELEGLPSESIADNNSTHNKPAPLTLNNIILEKCHQVKQVSDRLKELTEKKKWDEILELTSKKSLKLPREFLERGMLIHSYYEYAFAVSKAYQAKAKKVDTATAIDYYIQSISHCSGFLKDAQHYKPQDDTNKNCLLASQWFLYNEIGEASLRLYFAHMQPHSSEASYAWKALSYFQKALTANLQLRSSSKEFYELTKGTISQCKQKMFECYTALVIEAPNMSFKDRLFKELHNLLRELKEDEEIYQLCKNTLRILEKETQAQNLQTNPGRIGGQLRGRLIQKYRDEAVELSSPFLKKEKQENLKGKIASSYARYALLSAQHKTEEIYKEIRNMEGEVYKSFKPEGNHSIIDEMQEIKKIYKYLFDFRPCLFDEQQVLLCFLNNNQIDEALIRAQAFQELAFERNGVISWPLKLWVALLKNLNGDYQEWLAIEELVTIEQENNLIKEQELQTHIHNKKVLKIKKTLEDKRTEEANRTEEELIKGQLKPSVRPTHPASPEIHFLEEGAVSAEILRQEKLRRHEEKLKQKEEVKEVVTENLQSKSFKTALVKSDEVKPSFSSLEKLEFADTFNLKGLPLRIDQEIFQDEWRFNREELQAYFEALGCTSKAGKGSHNKVQLPETVHIMRNDQLITILNKEGGALTLPEWNDKVPHYLRKQILIARQKIFEISRRA